MADVVDTKITRAQGYRMTLTAILSYLPLIPIFWFLVKPALVNAVSVAMADDITVQVQESVRPINSAFKILLQRDIDSKKREIAALEHKRQFEPTQWSTTDTETLVDCQIELDSLIAAKDAL